MMSKNASRHSFFELGILKLNNNAFDVEKLVPNTAAYLVPPYQNIITFMP